MDRSRCRTWRQEFPKDGGALMAYDRSGPTCQDRRHLPRFGGLKWTGEAAQEVNAAMEPSKEL